MHGGQAMLKAIQRAGIDLYTFLPRLRVAAGLGSTQSKPGKASRPHSRRAPAMKPSPWRWPQGYLKVTAQQMVGATGRGTVSQCRDDIARGAPRAHTDGDHQRRDSRLRREIPKSPIPAANGCTT